MRVALKVLLAAATMLAVPACHKQTSKAADQNIGIDEDGLNNGAGNADIEELPPDESSGTSSNELESGADNPDVNRTNAPANSY